MPPTEGAPSTADRDDPSTHGWLATDTVPELELTFGYLPLSLRCQGTLDARTRHHLVAAVDELLAKGSSRIVVIDISHLHVADVDGANGLSRVQRMVRDAGARLRWEGLESDHLRGILPIQRRARRPSQQAALRANRPTHPALLPPSHPAMLPPLA